MDVVKYYTGRGVHPDEFVKVCGKLFPVRAEPLEKEPRIEFTNKKYRVPPCVSTTPQYQNALRLAVESIQYDQPIAHVEKIEDDATFHVRPISYAIRTAFTTFIDVKYMGYTLRDVIFPRPFSVSGHFEGVNNYPYPKPMGANVFLIDPENNLVLQERGNLTFDPHRVAATAAGGVEFDTIKNEKNPLRKIIQQELEEEVNYTGKIRDLTYLGYVVNYEHLLDISHVYIGWATEPISEKVKNYEVSKVIKIPLEKLQDIEKIICNKIHVKNISTILAGAIELLNRKAFM